MLLNPMGIVLILISDKFERTVFLACSFIFISMYKSSLFVISFSFNFIHFIFVSSSFFIISFSSLFSFSLRFNSSKLSHKLFSSEFLEVFIFPSFCKLAVFPRDFSFLFLNFTFFLLLELSTDECLLFSNSSDC